MDWQREVDSIFGALQQGCEIMLTKGCAMHVHVSSGPSGRFNLEQLKRMIKQVVYYDSPLTKLMPPDRKRNKWAASNVEVIPQFGAAHDQVEQRTWAPFFDRIDRYKKVEAILRDYGMNSNRYLSWNFKNALDIGCGTIEFRRPPGVDKTTAAKHWAAFALGYTAHAIELQQWSKVRNTNSYPSTQDLRRAICSGVQALGQNSQNALILSLLEDDNRLPTYFTLREFREFVGNKNKKVEAKKLRPYIEKVCFTITRSIET